MPLEFWVDIESASGAILGKGPITTAQQWNQSQQLDRAGSFDFTLLLDERSVDLIRPKRYAFCRALINDTVTTVGGGIIDSIAVDVSARGEIMRVSGPDLLAELRRPSTERLEMENTKLGPFVLMVKANGLLDPYWGFAGFPATQNNFSLKFAYESVLSGFSNLSTKSGEHFTGVVGERRIHWLGSVDNFSDSGLFLTASAKNPIRVGQNVVMINSIEQTSESWDLANRVFVFGAGEGENRLSLLAATAALPAGWTYDASRSVIENLASQSEYGIHETAISIKDIRPLSNNDADLINAANMLLLAGYNWTRKKVTPHITYSIDATVPNNPIRVGQTVLVEARRHRNNTTLINIREQLNVLEVRSSVGLNGLHTAGLTVSTIDAWPETDESYLISRLNESIIMESHPQMGPSIDTISYDAKLDADTNAQLRFWLGEETTTVNEVIVRFRVDPLQSSVKSVGGDASVNLEIELPSHSHTIPDHSHTVPDHSHTVASHTHSVPNHDHHITLANTGGTLRNLSVAAVGSNAIGFYEGTDVGDLNFTTNSSTGATTSSSGGGGTSGAGGGGTSGAGGGGTSATGGSATVAGEIDISGAITTVYGIFEESSSNTLALSDIAITVNSASPQNSVVDEGTGWFSLDITPNIVNSYNRPNQAQNTIVFSTSIDKTARILAQIERRTVIQSIANF